MFARFFTLFLMLILAACGHSEPQLKPLSANASVLAFGDSLTYGTGANSGEDYPSVLAQLIGHPVVNAGIPGEISADGLQRLPALLDEHQPDLLIIMHGGNDILRHLDLNQTRDNLKSMIDLARQRGIEVVLLGVPEFGLLLHTAPIYQQLAETEQVALQAEALPAILAQASLKADQVHPNAAGYLQLAQQIAEFLKQRGVW